MIQSFTFNGMNSREFGIYISGSASYNAPERSIEKIEIPGRNGSLTLDNHRFLNISVTYPAFIKDKFSFNSAGARMWLLQNAGYCKLEDSYNTDTYRMARFTGPIDFDMRFLNWGGETNLVFDCMPQRFYYIGDFPIEIDTETTLLNPSGFPALPLITVYGNAPGTLTIGQNTVSVLQLTDYIVLDSNTQNAYKGLQNMNQYISAPVFPTLESGENVIGFSGGIEKIEIIPRWWTI